MQTSTSSALVTAMTTAFSTTAGDALDAIAAIVPIALPILGAIIVVSIGIRVFKKVAGR